VVLATAVHPRLRDLQLADRQRVSSWVVWFAGFFVLPWTTITYAMMWGIYSDRVFGVEWVFVGLAFLLDLLTWSTLRDR
jgi:hypothetical protein